MTKREIMNRYLAGEDAGDRVPAAFFLHFGEGYRSGSAAIQRHREFFEFTDMDFVKIQFELAFPKMAVVDAGDLGKVPYMGLKF